MSEGNSAPIVAVLSAFDAIEPAQTVLRELSPSSFLTVLYFDPRGAESARSLISRLSASTSFEVSLAVSGQKLEPGHVLVIPSGVGPVLKDKTLSFEPYTAKTSPAILDRLLSSVASEAGDRSIAVLLSASDGDGLEGLRALRSAGGITLVRESSEREDHDLIAQAIEAGVADRVLKPSEMGKELLELAERLKPDGRPASPFTPEVLRPILRKLVEKSGVDFSGYRSGTLQRRIARRMALLDVVDPAEFLAILEGRPSELDELFEDLLIHVTSFFRDAETYDTLVRSIVPELLRVRKPPDGIRVWVPGCSTGEEVYSLAILLLEAIEKARIVCPLQIFASDISERSLARARQGLYPEAIRQTVSDDRLRRYFSRTADGYQIVKKVRGQCIFVRHDLTRNPSFSRMDLVSCRNLLIYFDEDLQRRALDVFHFALRPGGFLVLGESETLEGVPRNFERFGKAAKIYVRKPGESPVSAGVFTSPIPRLPTGMPPVGPLPGRAQQAEVERQAVDLLLARHVPATFVVNERLDILHLWGRTSLFIEPTPGKPELNLLRMLRSDLRPDVRLAIHQANREGQPAHRERIRLRGKTPHQTVRVDVEPLPPREGSGERFFVVLLSESTTPASASRSKGRSAAGQKAQQAELERLRADLTSSIEYGQSFVKEYESVNASLSAANEEIISTNEEIQSTNEELETAKEELQAANEELLVQNQDLSRLNADLTNLLSSSESAILMLDGDRRIRRATTAAQIIFGILPNDQGRSINDLKAPFRDVQLGRLLNEVLRTTAPLSREVQDNDGKWHSLQIRPYRTGGGQIDGAVLSVHDIDAIKRREEERREAQMVLARLAAIIESSEDAIISKTPDGIVTSWNRAAERLFGYLAAEIVGKPIQLIIPEDRQDEEHAIIERLLRGERLDHFETVRRRKDGTFVEVSLSVSPIKDGSGQIVGASKIARDIGERKRNFSAAARLAAIVESSNDPIVSKTLDGTITSWNRAAERVFGYTAAEMVGQSILKIVPPDRHAEEKTILSRIGRGERIDHFETVRRRKDGTLVEVSVSISPILDASGRIVGASKVATDISRLKREVAERTAELEAFSYSIAHDLRAPLRSLHRFSDILTEEYGPRLDDHGRDYLKRLADGAARMDRLIEDLLDYSRVSRTDIHLRPVDLDTLISEIRMHLSAEIDDQKGRLVVQPGFPKVQGDPVLLRQALENLISNALKFVAPGTRPEVMVTAEPLPEAIRIRVQDNGIGIAREHHERVFKMFERLNAEEDYPGTGVGLAIVKKAVERMNGRLGMDSEPGRGSTFWIELPPAK